MTEDLRGSSARATKRSDRDRLRFGSRYVLRTESQSQYVKILTSISADVGPTDFYERAFVETVAFYTWETMQLRRIKTGILNNALPKAIQLILARIRLPGPHSLSHELMIQNLKDSEKGAFDWMYDQERDRIWALLEEAGFDEAAVEAEAYLLVAAEFEQVDRMLNSKQKQLDNAVRSFARYRKTRAVHIRRNVDRVLAEDEAPSILVGSDK